MTAEDEAASRDESNRQKPIKLTSVAELDDLVDTNETVLVELYTTGCGICASMEPVLGNVARVTDAVVATVNLGIDTSLVERYVVRSVPTLLLFRNGDVVGRLADGFQGTEAVVEFVESTR
ncbi:MAG: thioredoxin family protein [Halobacteriota archaeon]